MPPALVAIMPPTVAVSRAARSTANARRDALAHSCSLARVTPADAVTWTATSSTGSRAVNRVRLMITGGRHEPRPAPPTAGPGTPPPTKPVLPPWGTIATPAARQARTTAATSAVVAGRT